MNNKSSNQKNDELVKIPKFTPNEIDIYNKQSKKCFFENPTEEYKWSITQIKTCSKCSIEKNLTEFNGNTSGTDAFDKNGYRLRRSECSVCTKKANKSKIEAKNKAKELGIPFEAPIGTLCGICNKSSSNRNKMVFDHCHEKNIFRGYLCDSCNRSIGVLGDNIDGIIRVFNYLSITDKCTIIQNEDGSLKKI